MRYNQLGHTSIKVSEICLGTMTFGHQNTEEEAHDQLDFALDQGVNFIDTAEMYPVPPVAETFTLTEKLIGTWLRNRKDRDKIILASKMLGPRDDIDYKIRKYDRSNIIEAVNGSLQRLQTDYMDLFQLHWPERRTNNFGQLGYKHRTDDPWNNNILEVLEIFDDLIKEGKIRYIGLSNETPWGACEFIHLAKTHDLPRVVSIQNPYSLLNRSYEVGLAEVSIREHVGLLAYSPLGFGMLTGKFYKDSLPAGTRIALYKQMARYSGPLSKKAADMYTEIARSHNLSPAQMALAYINSRPFLTSTIVGATSLVQLKENIESTQVNLSNEVLGEIEKVHQLIPNPAP